MSWTRSCWPSPVRSALPLRLCCDGTWPKVAAGPHQRAPDAGESRLSLGDRGPGLLIQNLLHRVGSRSSGIFARDLQIKPPIGLSRRRNIDVKRGRIRVVVEILELIGASEP